MTFKFVFFFVTHTCNDTCRTVRKGGVVNRYEIASLYQVILVANRCISLKIFIALLPNALLA
jgi:hypothetical protein